MTEEDFHGIKSLVSQVSTANLSTLTTLADPIVSQQNVGCVVTTGEAGVCGFGTILNLLSHKSVPGMQAIVNLLKDLAKKNPKTSKTINRMMKPDDLNYVGGLVLKERLINCPFEIAPNLHKVLIDDVNWSISSEYEPDEGETRDDYMFTHLVFLSQFEIEQGVVAGAAPVEGGEVHKMKKKRKMDAVASKSSRIYLHWEDEVFIERAVWDHSWQTGKETVIRGGKKFHAFFVLYCLKWQDYTEIVQTLG
jgi:hypothetical protein